MGSPCEKKTGGSIRRRKAAVRKAGKDISSPIDRGLSEEEAVREAGRCLAVARCDACELCSLLCPDLCITRDREKGVVLIDLDFCKGCGICAAVCPKKAISMVLEK